MKIFVFTYDRYNAISTSSILENENIEHSVLCHSFEAKEKYLAAGTVVPERLIATGAPKGLARNRNAALELLQENEWALFLVDDWIRATEYLHHDNEPTGNVTAKLTPGEVTLDTLFATKIPMSKFVERAKQLTSKADSLGVTFAGFAAYNSPLFRKQQWRRNTLVDGRAYVIKKNNIRFDERVETIEDYAMSAEQITHGGGTLVNQWVLPLCHRYTRGGYGTLEERSEQKQKDCALLVSKYPRLISYREKKGQPPKSHIALSPMSDVTLEKYRMCLDGLRAITGYSAS